MCSEHSILTVHWHEVLRPRCVQKHSKLFFTSVTRHVRPGLVIGDNPCPESDKVVDRVVHRHLVTRDRAGRHDDRVVVLNRDVAMVVVSSAANAELIRNDDPYELLKEVAEVTFERIENERDKIDKDPNHLGKLPFGTWMNNCRHCNE